jgi:hypothetical protein
MILIPEVVATLMARRSGLAKQAVTLTAGTGSIAAMPQQKQCPFNCYAAGPYGTAGAAPMARRVPPYRERRSQ